MHFGEVRDCQYEGGAKECKRPLEPGYAVVYIDAIQVKNRGLNDVCIGVCDDLKGLPEAATKVRGQAIVWARVIHVLRNTFQYALRKY